MTTPDERTRAVLQTREFLHELCAGRLTGNVPEQVLRKARQLLRHYPNALHLHAAAVAWPSVWSSSLTSDVGAPSYLDLRVRLQKLDETRSSIEEPPTS